MANTLKFGNGEWAIKEGSALAYNDENGNFKPLPFDFTRASTATYVAEDGLIKTAAIGEPRIDFLDNSDGALKLEPQRTNLITYSEDFSDSSWAKQNGGTGSAPVVTSNNTISPDGTQNADKVVFDKGLGSSTSDLSILSASFTSQSNTASVYIKADSAQRIVIRNSGTWVGYDIGTEWTKIEKTDTGGSLQIGLRDGYGIANVPNTATVYLWGAQVEPNSSYATSYIPTQGSSVTRVADTCSQTPPDGIIGQTEGTMFLDIDFINIGAIKVLLSVHDGASNKRLEFWSNGLEVNGFIGGSVNIAIGNTTISEGRHKLALAYNQSGDQAFYVDGVQIGISNTVYNIAALTELSYGIFSGNSDYDANGNINNTKLYTTRLSNSELATLTTL